MKIYTASSWKNTRYDSVVAALKSRGHEVYDFRNPGNDAAFNWEQIDPEWESLWHAADRFRKALKHPLAEAGFESDLKGMEWAEVCVLVNPCGRSAHMEAGWFTGQRKPVVVLLEDAPRWELTYKLATTISKDVPELFWDLKALEEGRPFAAELVRAGIEVPV